MENPRQKLGRLLASLVLVLAAVTLYCYHLGSPEIDDNAQAQVAVLAKSAVASDATGEQLPPTVEPQLKMPPLYLWLVQSTARLEGELEAFEVRLPAALSTVLLVLVLTGWFYLHSRRYQREDSAEAPPEGFALLAGLMIASCPAIFIFGRIGTPAALTSLGYIVGAFLWGESLEARRSFYAGRPWRFWLLMGYFAAGLTMLSGGPVVLLMMWAPYVFATHSYRMRRPDWAHLPGLALALIVGGAWPLTLQGAYPHHPELDNLWRRWAMGTLGAEVRLSLDFGRWFAWLLLGSLPWILPALVMIGRVWQRKDRSPTLVFWMWSVLANFALLSVLLPFLGANLIPMAAFTMLLASHGIYYWNFEHPLAIAWRRFLRVLIVLAILVGIFLAAVINADLGMTLLVLIALGWAFWAWESRRSGIIYTPWQTMVRLVSIGVAVIIALELMLLSDWYPRARFHNDTIAYFHRIENYLKDHEDSSRLYLLGSERVPLYDYYLEDVALEIDLDRRKRTAGPSDFVFVLDGLDAAMGDSSLAPMTFRLGDDLTKLDGMFRIIPPEEQPAAAEPPIVKFNHRPIYRMALLGSQGTRKGHQREVAERLTKYSERQPIENVLMLGNNIWGPSVFDHLDIIDSFEEPYKRLLKNGVIFNAVLGHEDQSYGWAQTHYPAFHMEGQRYYSYKLVGDLVEVFVLDSIGMIENGRAGEAQLAWFEEALSQSTARWKIVGLYSALFSDARNAQTYPELAETLKPLFSRYRVDLVAWAGEEFYERLKLPGMETMFFNAGWSGARKNARFQPTDRQQAGHDSDPGFLLLEIDANRIAFRAITDRNELIDQGIIEKPLIEVVSAREEDVIVFDSEAAVADEPDPLVEDASITFGETEDSDATTTQHVETTPVSQDRDEATTPTD